MDSTDPATVVIPFNLGSAAAFDQSIFPLAYYEAGDDNLSKGTYLIKATLDEMRKMQELGADLLNKNDGFIFSTRLKVEALTVKKAKLEGDRKTLNPFKTFLNYRAARLFHAATKDLYLKTKRVSEKIQREDERMRVVPSAQMRMVNNAVSPDAPIGGVSIELPGGQLRDNAERIIREVNEMLTSVANPFQDNTLISQFHDDERHITLDDTMSLRVSESGAGEGSTTSITPSDVQRATSSQTITHIHYNVYQNSILAANSSNLSGFTANSGDRNSGASTAQLLPP